MHPERAPSIFFYLITRSRCELQINVASTRWSFQSTAFSSSLIEADRAMWSSVSGLTLAEFV
jgi:hypothetical protein